MTLPFWELLVRLSLAVVLCGLVGLERESRDQVAGLRTHILVGLGAALFTIVSAYGFEAFVSQTTGPGAPPRVDPTRIAAQIVAGIGFLGAGAIIRQGFTVRGLTTAAALWIVAAIGMAAGAGYYSAAVATTLIALVALVAFRRVRPTLMRYLRTDFVVLDFAVRGGADLSAVFALLARRGVRVDAMHTAEEEEGERIRLELRVPPQTDFGPTLGEIEGVEGVTDVTASGVRPVMSGS